MTTKVHKKSVERIIYDPEEVKVSVVKTAEEFQMAAAVRAMCFVGEQGLPYHKIFDENDHIATHFLSTVRGEPVGTMRIRFFNGFAKIERSCVRQDYRSTELLMKANEYMIDYVSQKGYTKVTTSAHKSAARLWRILGFRPLTNQPFTVGFHDTTEYLELVCNLEVPNDAVTLDSPPLVKYRMEGRWRELGAYEKHLI